MVCDTFSSQYANFKNNIQALQNDTTLMSEASIDSLQILVTT